MSANKNTTAKLSYELRESARAKRVRITVYDSGRVVATKPRRVSSRIVRNFVARQAAWIEKIRAKYRRAPTLAPWPRYTREAKEAARRLVEDRALYFSRIYDVPLKRIAIRNQKARWGSCSRQGNLNFNYRIMALPSELADYVIVHELCHLRELNHSAAFWRLVAQALPQYRELRERLRALPLRQ